MYEDILVATITPGPYNKQFPLPALGNFRMLSTQDKRLSQRQHQLINRADIFLLENNPDYNQLFRHYRGFFDAILESGRPWIVIEAPVFRKNLVKPPDPRAYYRWSWYSYFRDAGDYCNQNSPSDRWQRIQAEHDIEIRSWQQKGSNILFMMQRPGDTSLGPAISRWGSYQTFIEDTVIRIRQHTDRPVRIRLHPQRHRLQMEILDRVLSMPDVEISEFSREDNQKWVEGGKGLRKDLNRAWAVVGLNSNSLTETVCAGIPTWSMDPSSMAWPVSHHDLSQIENPDLTIERTQWLYDMGYTQWRHDEVLEGLSWHHLMRSWPNIQARREKMPDWPTIQEAKAQYINDNYYEDLRREYFFGQVKQARMQGLIPKKF
jgi:hypothetical protein